MKAAKKVDAELVLTSPQWSKAPGEELYYWSPQGAAVPQALTATSDLRAAAQKLRGQWTVIDLRGSSPQVATDRMLSRPITYTRQGEQWLIADDIENLRGRVPFTWNSEAAATFPHLGYTLGSATLIDGIALSKPGTLVELGEEAAQKPLFAPYRFVSNPIEDPEQFSADFTRALDQAFERMLADMAGRKFLVPLSGGLDSRLLMVWLRKFGVQDVLAFSYGKRGLSEAGVAQQVAAELGFPFEFLEYDPATIARAWNGPEGTAFVRGTWGGFSLPHIQDWEALRQLHGRGLADNNSVYLPGHTIVGNTHDQWLLDANPSPADLSRVILKHHANLLRGHDAASHSPAARASVRAALEEAGFDGSPRSTQAAIEVFNLRERQPKYINNSVRGYEHFGATWAMPMLDTELWETWLRGGRGLTEDRAWYEQYVNSAYQSVGGSDLGLYDLRSGATKSFVRSSLGKALAKSAVGMALNDVRNARIYSQHPLALEAYSEFVPAFTRSRRLLRGDTPLGMWSEGLLDGTWVPEGTLVDGFSE